MLDLNFVGIASEKFSLCKIVGVFLNDSGMIVYNIVIFQVFPNENDYIRSLLNVFAGKNAFMQVNLA